MKHFSLILLIGMALSIASCKNDKNSKADIEKSQTIEKINLSPKVKAFIDENYSGYSIKNVADDPLCDGGDAIDVAISNAGSPLYSLIFTPDGTFVQQEEDVDLSLAPQTIIQTVENKFKEFKPAQQIEKLILADKTTQYLLDLSNETETIEVIFNTDGTIACQSKD